MTGLYVLTPRAEHDIDDVWEYTISRRGEDQAEFYIRQLDRQIRVVAKTPLLGRPCPELRAGYFRHPFGSHVIFYRLSDNGIDVVRILHASMDFQRHL